MYLLNPAARRDAGFRGLFGRDEYDDVRSFFDARPDLSATPLTSLPTLARALGVAALDVKNETGRFGLSAFKIAGVSYALHRLSAVQPLTHVMCATAGNHGRAVARAARERGLRCTVCIPALRTTDAREVRTRQQRVAAMQSDGAEIVEVGGTYEDAVARAAELAQSLGATIVSDTSWDGYETIPRWIMAGYTRLFDEAARQWLQPPDAVVVQGGVGGLVCAAASWFASRFGEGRPFMIACEPDNAACLLASAAAGHAVTIDSSLDTIMAGLRCAAPSPVAWPAIAAGIDAFVTASDADVIGMMTTLGELPDDERIDAGPSGVCGLAALDRILREETYAPLKQAARMDRSSRVLAVVTEGA